MEEAIVLIVMIVMGILIAGGTSIIAIKEHMSTTKEIVNHNDRLTKFVYKIPMKREEIIEALRSAEDSSEIRCEVDPSLSQLTFDSVNGRRKYVYAVREEKDYSYFYIKELYTPFQGHVEYKINSFIIANLGAELIPYSEDAFELD